MARQHTLRVPHRVCGSSPEGDAFFPKPASSYEYRPKTCLRLWACIISFISYIPFHTRYTCDSTTYLCILIDHACSVYDCVDAECSVMRGTYKINTNLCRQSTITQVHIVCATKYTKLLYWGGVSVRLFSVHSRRLCCLVFTPCRGERRTRIQRCHTVLYSIFLHPTFISLALLVLRSLPTAPQTRDHVANPPPPSPLLYACLPFYGENNSTFSSLVDSRQIVPTHTLLSAQRSFFSFIFANKVKSHHGGNRTQGPMLVVVFEGNH